MSASDVRIWTGSEWVSIKGPTGPTGPTGAAGDSIEVTNSATEPTTPGLGDVWIVP